MVDEKKVEDAELESAEDQAAAEEVEAKPEEKAEEMQEEKPVEEKAEEKQEEKPAEEKAEEKQEEKPVEEKPQESEKTESEEAPGDETAKDAEDEGEEEQPEPVQRASRSGRHGVISGIVHVMATFNNTKVTITDRKGNVIAWRSGGRCGFKGSRKSTAYAATIVAQEAAREAASKGLREAEVRLNGPGAGRESAVRAVHAARIKVTSIQDVTPIPHNGCRPPKRRRV